MEIAAYAQLRDVNFIGAKYFARAADGVVFRMRKIVNVVDVRPDFRSEKRSRVRCILRAGITVQPGKICKREGLRFPRMNAGSVPAPDLACLGR